MLTESEQQIVDQKKIWGFGAYLQCAYLHIYHWSQATQCGQLLPKEELQIIYNRMYEMGQLFDLEYGEDEGELLILREEKIAWTLLSENILSFLERFMIFLSQVESPSQELMALNRQLMREYETLIQEWNIISKAYKAKHERSWGKIPETQRELRMLIDSLKTSVHDILPHQINIPE